MNKWHKSTISEAFLTDNYRNTHSSPEGVQNDHIPEGLMHLRLSSFGAEAWEASAERIASFENTTPLTRMNISSYVLSWTWSCQY